MIIILYCEEARCDLLGLARIDRYLRELLVSSFVSRYPYTFFYPPRSGGVRVINIVVFSPIVMSLARDLFIGHEPSKPGSCVKIRRIHNLSQKPCQNMYLK